MNKKMTKKERNIRRGIFFTATAVIVLLICGSRAKPVSVESYGIDYGDTLWNIAEEYKPDSMAYSEYINTLYKLNEDLTANIHAGQSILIPVYKEK